MLADVNQVAVPVRHGIRSETEAFWFKDTAARCGVRFDAGPSDLSVTKH